LRFPQPLKSKVASPT